MEKFNVILASGSPRRKELLRLIFSEFEVLPSPFDEESLKMGILRRKRWWKPSPAARRKQFIIQSVIKILIV